MLPMASAHASARALKPTHDVEEPLLTFLLVKFIPAPLCAAITPCPSFGSCASGTTCLLNICITNPATTQAAANAAGIPLGVPKGLPCTKDADCQAGLYCAAGQVGPTNYTLDGRS
jgi:hypothetical protein